MYPRSFLKLLLLGFALALLPLLFAFGNSAVYLDRLAEQSRSMVEEAVKATRASRVLVEQLVLMERSARQYYVLGDMLLLRNYSYAHDKFAENITELQKLPISQRQHEALDTLGAQESQLYEELHHTNLSKVDPDSGMPAVTIAKFVQLSDQAQAILAENNRLIDSESTSLASNAEHAQQILFWQTLTLLPVGLIVAMIITYLVARPIRRMDEAIKHLGEGNFEDSIRIDGPGDMRILGQRLDWLRTQLKAVDQEKQRFLRHVSHELKTPLTAIRQGSELLTDEVGGTLTAQQKEITGILRDSSLRLQNMIENLLYYTAAQYKKPQLLLNKVQLSEMVRDILQHYALTLDSKAITVTSELQPTELHCDQIKIRAVIDNLISNAIKYTPQAGHIKLQLSQQQGQVVIDVCDNGPGVLETDRTRLFDPFYRGSAVYESLVSGSGLGLSIAKEYVDAHGGEILLVPSEQGAHFRVRLPFLNSTQGENAHEHIHPQIHP